MANFTQGSGPLIRYVVEQFKLELNFERFNPNFYNKNFFFNC
jgi:hypothetical protein